MSKKERKLALKREKELWALRFIESFEDVYREYGLTKNDREELLNVYLDLRKNPYRYGTKKLKKFRNLYRAKFIKNEGWEDEEQYRIIYKLKPYSRQIIITKFADRATVYDNIAEQYDWDDEYIYVL